MMGKIAIPIGWSGRPTMIIIFVTTKVFRKVKVTRVKHSEVISQNDSFENWAAKRFP